MTVIMHSSMQRSLAFILANKLQSSTLLGTQLTRLFVEAYEVRGGGGAGQCWRCWRCWRCCYAGSCAVDVDGRGRPPSAASVTHASVTCPSRSTTPHAPHTRNPKLQDDPSLVEAAVADLQAVMERDPACDTHVQPLWFFKGFQVGGRVGGRAERAAWGGDGMRFRKRQQERALPARLAARAP